MPGSATDRSVPLSADGGGTGGPGRGQGRRAGGSCERHLEEAVSRFAPLLRAAVVGLCGLLGLVGHAGHAGHAGDGVAVVVVVVATALPCAQSRWRVTSPTAFLVASAVLSAAVGLSQVLLGPQPISGWLFAIVSITSVTCYFEWPDRPWAGHALAGSAIAAYVVGCLLAGGVVSAPGVWHPLVQAVLSWSGLLLVRRAARLCDHVARRAERRRIAVAAARAQREADRAYLAMLHDTASTTLLMVSTDTTGDFDWLPAAARHDLQVLTSYAPVTERDVDLGGLLTSLTAYPGLTVHTDVQCPLTVPSKPAYAIYHGVREALSNVHRHAGDLDPTLTGLDRDGLVVVRLSDCGRGFEPGEVPAYRRGLAESVHARMVAAGGAVHVRSAPGRGTTVEWTWTRG